MPTTIPLLLLLIAPQFCEPQADAILWGSRVEDMFTDTDVLDAYSIGNVCFVVRRSQLPMDDEVCKDVSKVLPVDRAVIHARPGFDQQLLINQLLGQPHRLRLDSICLVDHGDAGFVWTTTWDLYPAVGGSSGIPFQYRVHVKPNGALIVPEHYLCDVIGDPGLDQILLSVLAFDDLNRPAGDIQEGQSSTIFGDEALDLARTAVQKLLEPELGRGETPGFRFYDQSAIDVPIRTKHDGSIEKRKVWAVNFIAADTAAENVHAVAQFTVWVTEDGFVSHLSRGSWQAISRRKPLATPSETKPE